MTTKHKQIDQDVTLNRQITYYFRFTIAPVEMNWNEIKPTRRIFFSFFYFIFFWLFCFRFSGTFRCRFPFPPIEVNINTKSHKENKKKYSFPNVSFFFSFQITTSSFGMHCYVLCATTDSLRLRLPLFFSFEFHLGPI